MFIAGEVGIRVRHIGLEYRRFLHLYPFQAHEKNALVAGQMGDIVEGGPLPGGDAPTELQCRQVAYELADTFMLVLKARKCRY